MGDLNVSCFMEQRTNPVPYEGINKFSAPKLTESSGQQLDNDSFHGCESNANNSKPIENLPIRSIISGSTGLSDASNAANDSFASRSQENASEIKSGPSQKVHKQSDVLADIPCGSKHQQHWEPATVTTNIDTWLSTPVKIEPEDALPSQVIDVFDVESKAVIDAQCVGELSEVAAETALLSIVSELAGNGQSGLKESDGGARRHSADLHSSAKHKDLNEVADQDFLIEALEGKNEEFIKKEGKPVLFEIGQKVTSKLRSDTAARGSVTLGRSQKGSKSLLVHGQPSNRAEDALICGEKEPAKPAIVNASTHVKVEADDDVLFQDIDAKQIKSEFVKEAKCGDETKEKLLLSKLSSNWQKLTNKVTSEQIVSARNIVNVNDIEESSEDEIILPGHLMRHSRARFRRCMRMNIEEDDTESDVECGFTEIGFSWFHNDNAKSPLSCVTVEDEESQDVEEAYESDVNNVSMETLVCNNQESMIIKPDINNWLSKPIKIEVEDDLLPKEIEIKNVKSEFVDVEYGDKTPEEKPLSSVLSGDWQMATDTVTGEPLCNVQFEDAAIATSEASTLNISEVVLQDIEENNANEDVLLASKVKWIRARLKKYVRNRVEPVSRISTRSSIQAAAGTSLSGSATAGCAARHDEDLEVHSMEKAFQSDVVHGQSGNLSEEVCRTQDHSLPTESTSSVSAEDDFKFQKIDAINVKTEVVIDAENFDEPLEDKPLRDETKRDLKIEGGTVKSEAIIDAEYGDKALRSTLSSNWRKLLGQVTSEPVSTVKLEDPVFATPGPSSRNLAKFNTDVEESKGAEIALTDTLAWHRAARLRSLVKGDMDGDGTASTNSDGLVSSSGTSTKILQKSRKRAKYAQVIAGPSQKTDIVNTCFIWSDEMTDCIIVHGEVPCPFCMKRFTSFLSHLEHLATHGILSYFCDRCNQNFESVSLMLSHLEMHKSVAFRCKQCDKCFRSVSYMREHVREHDSPAIFCGLCEKPFHHKSKLRKHMSFHYVVKKRRVRKLPKIRLNEFGQYFCEVCNATYIKSESLVKHLKLHQNEEKYFCNLCPQGFSDKSSLTTHLLFHFGDKPFECSYCQRRFCLKRELAYHLTLHKDGRMFDCNQCPKRFARRDYLRKHSRVHSGVKPFKCLTCKKSFNFSSGFYRHLKSNIHKMISYYHFNKMNDISKLVTLKRKLPKKIVDL